MTIEIDADTVRLVRALWLAAADATADPDHAAPDLADLTEIFARAAWARLAEPGDATAGKLIAAVGATTALAAVVAGKLPAQLTPPRFTERHFEEQSVTERYFDPAAFAKGVARWQPRLDKRATELDLRRALETGTRVLAPGDPMWPETFHELGPHAPVVLWVRGDASLLNKTSLAVVGARACTGYGSHITAEIVDGVCASGVAIVSGAAYGVDAVAHRTALAVEGATIAVLAGGIDRPYPQGHVELLTQIGKNGLVCSEMVPGSAPTRWRFLQRNRLVAAMARATLVTEAGVRSGSLNTAGHASELSRALGAVPGPVTSPASAGCHKLVRDYNATLVTNAADAQELLGIGADVALFDLEPGADRPLPLHRRVLDALPLRGARGLTEVTTEAGVTRAEARGALAELELLGHVAKVATGGAEGHGWTLLPSNGR